ncbi:MAG: SNF2-related protein, partial [Planctomycetota bacterium]|nr:SNF2-related protein [Planctomycetota bacterium]
MSQPVVEVFASGMNSALQRAPRLRAVTVPLSPLSISVEKWRPTWPKPKTIGLRFPEAPEPPRPALPPKPEPANGGVEGGSSAGAGPEEAAKAAADGQSADPPTVPLSPPVATLADLLPPREGGTLTRIKPPAEAISIEDRLFYLLQPPLETWLKGQELVMPFEPFPYQYEGIAWLFSQKAGLLADEMGLGKTMQTITAIRLLLRAGQVRRVLLVCPKPLIPNWQREFQAWADELPVVTVEGGGARRQMLWM